MDSTISSPTEVCKPWQKGISLETLKPIARLFQQHDGSRPLGAFSKVKENTVAIWLNEGRLAHTPTAAVAYKWLRSSQQVADFTGEPVLSVPAGSLSIERAAGSAAEIASLVAQIAPSSASIVWRHWADHPEEAAAAEMLHLRRSGTIIRASSEMLAISSRGCQPIKHGLTAADTVGIAPLSLEPPAGFTKAIAQWKPIVEQLWVDHYSSYNKKKSWSAVALRSFGGQMDFIEKPAEMSRKYQQEHPERLSWPIMDTPLLDQLPGARDILGSLGCSLERARLMRLGATGGELTRHADITDRNAGTRLGAIARLHLPLITHESVRFTTWDTNNQPRTLHMEPGRWWYLDVRKPHQAINESAFDRVHLVADCIVNEHLQSLISQAASR